MDEKSLILQYSSLFHYLSYPHNINNNNNTNNEIYFNQYNANYLFAQIGQPNFNERIISKSNISSYIKDNNQNNQDINNHFNVNMYSRYPKRVAFITENGETLKVEFEYEVFEDVIKSAGIRPIIFVSIIGRYQQGKTTIISGINGNYGNVIGNGYRETTKGVYIDGPYDINYLYQRFNIKLRENIYFDGNELLSPLIFFFDIEGYDGKMHGI